MITRTATSGCHQPLLETPSPPPPLGGVCVGRLGTTQEGNARDRVRNACHVCSCVYMPVTYAQVV